MTTRPISNVVSTWTSAGTSYTGLGVNVYSTAYATDSRPFNIRVNGNSVFSVDPLGTIRGNSVNIMFATANAAYNFANNLAVASGDPSFAFGRANSASNTAIAAFNTANASYGKANTSLQNTSGTLAGDLVVTGSLTTSSRGIAKSSVPSGSVLQVQTTIKSDQYYSGSGGWEDVSGLSVSITPTSSSSKILIQAHINCSKTGGGGDAFVRLLRDGNSIGNGNSGYFGQVAGQDYYAVDCRSVVYLDSPGTTNSVTYKVQFNPGGGGYINGRGLNGDFITSSTICLMEIAQ